MKPFIFDRACEFIREQTAAVTKLLTRQHHQLVDQFLAFKERTEHKLAWADSLQVDMAKLEVMIALKTPCMEAEHVLDDRNAFNFFDCLIPKIKEHRRFKLLPDSEFSLADFKCQQKVRQLEYELEKKQLPRLKEECEQLRKRCTQLETEAEVIKWYMATMERGIDTKDIAREFFKLQ